MYLKMAKHATFNIALPQKYCRVVGVSLSVLSVPLALLASLAKEISLISVDAGLGHSGG